MIKFSPLSQNYAEYKLRILYQRQSWKPAYAHFRAPPGALTAILPDQLVIHPHTFSDHTAPQKQPQYNPASSESSRALNASCCWMVVAWGGGRGTHCRIVSEFRVPLGAHFCATFKTLWDHLVNTQWPLMERNSDLLAAYDHCYIKNAFNLCTIISTEKWYNKRSNILKCSG